MIDSFRGDFRFLSNFWPAHVRLDGIVYATVEHAYQAAKTLDPAERAQISVLVKPGEAKRMGKRVTKRADWDDVKLAVMEDLLRQKFSGPPVGTSLLKFKLLRTGDEELVEGNEWGDTFWGVCRGVGSNHLGKLLMKIRAELAAR